MISLVVLLPPSGRVAAEKLASVPLAYARIDAAGRSVEQGVAVVGELPHSDMTVAVLSACDTLLLAASLPPVTGVRLQRVLPNLVEDQLVQDPQRSHICVDPVPAPDGGRYLAVVDRNWFASVIAVFAREGRGRLKAVPLTRCIPAASLALVKEEPTLVLVGAEESAEASAGDADGVPLPSAPSAEEADGADASDVVLQPASVLVLRYPSVAPAGDEEAVNVEVEVAVRRNGLGLGLEVDERRVAATLAGIAAQAPANLYGLALDALDGVRAELAGLPLLSLGELASAAVACRLDLCQFEFARSGRAAKGAKRWWQWAAGLAGAAVVVALIAVNVHWLQLRREQAALNAQMVAVLKQAFPDLAVVVDPQAQMASRLKGLFTASGMPRADDFAVEAASLSRALPPIASTSIEALDYSNGALTVTFRQDTKVDAGGFGKRLASNGLSARQEDGKWILESATSRQR